MKKTLFLLLSIGIALSGEAQKITDSFFSSVNYIGAFDGTNDWTAGWAEWDPVNEAYGAATTTKGNGLFTRATSTHITASETWSGIILLDGWVYVDDAVTLTINPGTIIRGTAKSALIIERGGILMAEGTSASPIVFTSNQGAGLRNNSDWAGLVLCGKAPNNLAGGEGIAEGGIESVYGGTNPNDNSGILKYIRIEFPGYEVATSKEINGLTLYSIGNGTVIDYIQVSNSGDDGFEWFGGTVNAKHLISYRTEDDDFDTDNGFIGRVQFGVIARDSSIVDTDAANAFESDTDADGSNKAPKTHAIFSNISAFGPAASASVPAKLRSKYSEGSAMRLRRNTRLQIYNSIFAGWGRGVRIESEGSYAATSNDSLTVQNCIVAGIRGVYFQTDASAGVSGVRKWYKKDIYSNDTLATAAALEITDPFNYSSRNFQPKAGAKVLTASYWFKPFVDYPDILNAFFTRVDYRGAFDGTTDWTSGWTEWDPINEAYGTTTSTKGNGLFTKATGTHITSNETWSGIVLLDGWVYVDAGATLTINPGTIIRGTAKSALIIERGGKIMAEGTSDNAIVFTSNQGAGLRNNSDWAGLVICGKAPNNLSGGEGIAEGGIESVYGGSNVHDNSGVLKYVRIEFPGYEVATSKEINGLTLYSVGDATTIDYIQVSHSGDDGFEWFGGTVNAKHLISYKTEDDDFDTDNGFSGMVQFGVIARDSSIVDTDAANAFESDNDADGSGNSPKTNAIFSNISAFGPAASKTEPTQLRAKHAEGSALRLRRNTRLKIYNSIFAGWGRGVRIESEGSYTSAITNDSLTVQNSLVAGIRGVYFQTDVSAGVSGVRNWFMSEELNNDTLASASELMITAPFNYTARNFQPLEDSPVLCGSIWASGECGLNVSVDQTTETSSISAYPNPFTEETTFNINLSNESMVYISILDINGREIETVFNGFASAGNSNYTFYSNGLTPGIYMARVIVNSNVKLIKLLVK